MNEHLPDDLTEFWLSIEYHTTHEPERMSVIARSADDAKQIALRLFQQHHTVLCVVDNVIDVSVELPTTHSK